MVAAALALKCGFPAAAARVDAARGHRRYCGAVRGPLQVTRAVAPSICSQNDGALFEFQSLVSGFVRRTRLHAPFAFAIRKGRWTSRRPVCNKNTRLKELVIIHSPKSASLYPKAHSFVTTSAQNFVKGPLRVAFKSTTTACSADLAITSYLLWQLVCSQWLGTGVLSPHA